MKNLFKFRFAMGNCEAKCFIRTYTITGAGSEHHKFQMIWLQTEFFSLILHPFQRPTEVWHRTSISKGCAKKASCARLIYKANELERSINLSSSFLARSPVNRGPANLVTVLR
jgi:hypothetical protein